MKTKRIRDTITLRLLKDLGWQLGVCNKIYRSDRLALLKRIDRAIARERKKAVK